MTECENIERTGLHMTIDSHLHRTAKAIAAMQGLRLRELVELAIQAYMDDMGEEEK